MFRFNNPDALLVLLLVGRGLRHRAGPRSRAAPAGWWPPSMFVGLGFDTKMLQAFVVVPAFAVVYLLAGAAQAAAAAVAAGGGRAWPWSSRPAGGWSRSWPIAGRRPALHRRLPGQQPAQPDLRLQRLRSPDGQRGGQRGRRRRPDRPARWGATGWTRMFNSEFGGQIAWLHPGRPDLPGWPGCGGPGGRRAPTAPGPPCCCGAAGWSSPALMFSFAPGHHPPLLHGGPRPGHRRPGRHRRRRPAGGAGRHRLGPLRAGRRPGRHVGLGLGAARIAAPAGCRGCARPSLVGRPASPSVALLVPWARCSAVPAPGVPRSGRRRPGHRPGRAGGVLPADGQHHPHRRHPLGRPGRRRRPRSAPAVPVARGAGGFGGTRRRAPAPPTAIGGVRYQRGHATGGPRRRRRPVAQVGGRTGGVGGLLDAGTHQRRAGERAPGRTPRPTPGWPPPSAPTRPPGCQLSTGDPVMAIGGFNGTDPATHPGHVRGLRGRRRDPLLRGRRAAPAAGSVVDRRPCPARSPPGSRATSPPATVGGTTVYDLTQRSTSSSHRQLNVLGTFDPRIRGSTCRLSRGGRRRAVAWADAPVLLRRHGLRRPHRRGPTVGGGRCTAGVGTDPTWPPPWPATTPSASTCPASGPRRPHPRPGAAADYAAQIEPGHRRSHRRARGPGRPLLRRPGGHLPGRGSPRPGGRPVADRRPPAGPR